MDQFLLTRGTTVNDILGRTLSAKETYDVSWNEVVCMKRSIAHFLLA